MGRPRAEGLVRDVPRPPPARREGDVARDGDRRDARPPAHGVGRASRLHVRPEPRPLRVRTTRRRRSPSIRRGRVPSRAASRSAQGQTFFLESSGFGIVPGWPAPRPDRLKFEEGYGIGGPGVRGRVMEGGVGGVPAPAMAMKAARSDMAANAPVSLMAEEGKTGRFSWKER